MVDGCRITNFKMKVARPYQTDCHNAIRDAFKAGKRRVIVELCTGAGKTVIFVLATTMACAKGKRVLILVNRDILIDQAVEELRTNGVFAQREQGQDRALLTAQVVVGSIQSMQGDRLKKWPKDYYALVITDEVHGSASKTFKTVLDHFQSAYHIGVTATAERHDKRGLWSGYEDIVYSMSLKQAIDQGWLCGFKFHELDCPVTVDLKLAKHATFGENEEVFDSKKYLPRLAELTVEHAVGKKGLLFLPNCRVSLQFAAMLKSLGLNAEHIDSSYMTATRTSELLSWYKTTPNAILCNADLLSVGFNDPPTDLIGLYRPVASTPMYKQRLGRGTRPIAPIDDYDTAEGRLRAIAESAKPHCAVLNVFFENGSHDLASPSCLITDSKEEQAALNKARKPGQNVDLAQLELQLKAKRMADVEEEMRKYAEKVANSQEKKKRGKLFVGDILRHRNPNHKPASPAFIKYIKRLTGAEIPSGEYSAYQMMRIKERHEKEMKKAA